MVTFILLVVTGLPQTRPDLSIAQGIIGLFGGIWTTRIIHRIVGVAFVVLMLTHVVRAVVRAFRRRRLPVMVPVRKDFEDIVHTFKHYLTGSPLPRVGKFDFSQKFEYWGLFLGGIVMSGSGLVLLFPELFTQVLPGILIAAIRTMHGLEATFAVLVVVLWHSYGVIFRPEIFPLDTTIFTGKMRLDRLKHEHALEYERLFPGDTAD
jgi:cytochrome b subunit of formate dehydrogenase